MPKVQHLHVERAELEAHRKELAAFKPDAAVDCRALTRADAETVLAALPSDLRLVVISSIDVYRAFGAVNEGRETDPVPLDETSPVRTNRYPYRGLMAGMEQYDKLDVELVVPVSYTHLTLPTIY